MTNATSEMGNTDIFVLEAISKFHFRMAPKGAKTQRADQTFECNFSIQH
jgi:hypothetical protein